VDVVAAWCVVVYVGCVTCGVGVYVGFVVEVVGDVRGDGIAYIASNVVGVVVGVVGSDDGVCCVFC